MALGRDSACTHTNIQTSMIKLRIALGFVVLACTSPIRSEAQAPVTIATIKEVADLVGGVGDALGKLTDGVQKMIIAGEKGLSGLAARRTHASMIELSKLTTGVALANRVAAIPALESYLRTPTAADWRKTVDALREVLVGVDTVLRRLNADKSDLVLQPVYTKLQASLRARADLLSRLASVPPPTTKAELAELRKVLARYRILVAQLESARDELNEYARETGTPTGAPDGLTNAEADKWFIEL